MFVFHGCEIQMQVARKMSQTVMPLQTAPKAELSHIAGLKASSIQKSYSFGIVITFFSHLRFSALLIPQEWLSFQEHVMDERRAYAPFLQGRKNPHQNPGL